MPSGTVKDALLSLGRCASVSEFLEALDVVIPSKKSATKSPPGLLLIETRESLIQDMDAARESDPALYLHLAVLILFSVVTGSLLQASGKFVPQIISFLHGKVSDEEYDEVREYQDAVVKFIKSKGKESSDTLKGMYPKLRELIENKCKQAGKAETAN